MEIQEEPATHRPDNIGEEELDPHIYDDKGDPHRTALEDRDANGKVSWSTLVAIFFLSFTVHPALSFTLLTVFPIMGRIGIELQGSTQNVSWMASGWSIGGSVAFAIAGQLSDYFGRRNIILCGQVLLIVGHIIGASARSVNQCIAGMVILGLGTGTIFVVYPGISELLPNRYRSVGVSFTDLCLLPFSTFGPLISLSLYQRATWRWVFILGAITGVVAFIGTAIFYTPPSRPLRDRTRRQILRELDYLGIFLYSAGLVIFLLGLGWAGVTKPWKSAAVLAPLIIGFLVFVSAFVWDFSGYAKRPNFPYHIMSNVREYTILLVLIFVVGLVYISMTDLIPANIAAVYTSDSIKAGDYNIPAGFGGSIGGVVLGSLSYRIRYIHLQFAVAIAIQTIFTALLALSTPNRLPLAIVCQFFANMPFAWITTCCYLTAGIHVPQRNIGLAMGLLGTFRFLGGAIGTTIFSTILENKSTPAILHRVTDAVLPLGFPPGEIPALISYLSNGSPFLNQTVSTDVVNAATTAIRWGWSDAYKIVWLTTIPFGVIAFAGAFFVRDPSPYLTKHIAVTLEKERLNTDQKEKSTGVEVQHLENSGDKNV
ncbi:putative siderophore iron transporter [Talaromyces proteolyticus]|uniref:Siderophore iron transporter n=1 Tax=Talaromyces proteolyticus TaxID=1131652 RepID=A0AAD4L0K5_9EURO|nr:putative siderophore iron transporter [Talaromyces proteolyticus]KAH8704018.1 putative siderophore iron transporter [Talaromyces proteolyticus]